MNLTCKTLYPLVPIGIIDSARPWKVQWVNMKNNRIVFQIRDRVQSNVMWMCCTQIYMGCCLKTQSTKMQCTNGCTRRLWEFNCIYSHVTSERSKLVMFVMYATSLCVQHILYGIFPIQEIFYTHVRFYSLWETVSEKKSIYFGTSVFGTKHLMSTVWILSSTLRCIVCVCVCACVCVCVLLWKVVIYCNKRNTTHATNSH